MSSQTQAHHRCGQCRRMWRLVLSCVYQTATQHQHNISHTHKQHHSSKYSTTNKIEKDIRIMYRSHHITANMVSLSNCTHNPTSSQYKIKKLNDIRDTELFKLHTYSHWQSWKVRRRSTHLHNNNNSMLIVQYPVQFSGPPRNISNPCSTLLCTG